jgi:gamma-glutamylcysteine synthetase
MTDATLLQAIEAKYITPTRRTAKKLVGIEFEFPIVNLQGEAVQFDIVHALTDAFVAHFAFHQIRRDEEGNIYCAVSEHNGDGISFDCSYNTLELSFGAEENLHLLYHRFVQYYRYIQNFFAEYNYTLTGMGINPNYAVNTYEPVHSARYRMLYRHLSSYGKYENTVPFHNVPHYGMFSCASQVQLDVSEAQIPEVLNTFSKLEPIKAILFANSYWENRPEALINRDYFWRNSLHGLNPHNVGAYETVFASAEEVVQYISTMSLYCTERDGNYINFAPTPLRDYFSADTISGEYFDGETYRTISFHPEIGDLKHLRSFKFEDLTFRGTVEFRSVCMQPVQEIMSAAAFHVGLMKNLPALTDLFAHDHVLYGHGYNALELRELLSRRHLPHFVNRKALKAQIAQILALAKDGLHQRGYGEEVFLQPLYARGEALLSPAKQMLAGLEAGKSMQDILLEYASLDSHSELTERMRAFVSLESV